MITHLATYFAPSAGQRHVDYVFQYRWEEEFYRGTNHLSRVLGQLERSLIEGGDVEVLLNFPSKRDPLRSGQGRLEPLRYWRSCS